MDPYFFSDSQILKEDVQQNREGKIIPCTSPQDETGRNFAQVESSAAICTSISYGCAFSS